MFRRLHREDGPINSNLEIKKTHCKAKKYTYEQILRQQLCVHASLYQFKDELLGFELPVNATGVIELARHIKNYNCTDER